MFCAKWNQYIDVCIVNVNEKEYLAYKVHLDESRQSQNNMFANYLHLLFYHLQLLSLLFS